MQYRIRILSVIPNNALDVSDSPLISNLNPVNSHGMQDPPAYLTAFFLLPCEVDHLKNIDEALTLLIRHALLQINLVVALCRACTALCLSLSGWSLAE